jgi:hypothetical protein
MGKLLRFPGKDDTGTEEPPVDLLQDLGGLAVVVEDLGPAAARVGIDHAQLETHIERALAQGGVATVPLDEIEDRPDAGVCYVRPAETLREEIFAKVDGAVATLLRSVRRADQGA